jgi:hypothetical protein
MGISVFPVASSSALASNDFTVNVGTTGFTNVSLSANFPAGSYITTSSLSDTTLDIYLVASDGSSAGYANATTGTTSITATKAFNTVVVYGGANNDTLAFVFKNVFAPADISMNSGVAPRAVSASTSTLANQNDTVTITGQNFASGITATFTGTDNTVRNAKAVVRNSSTSLTITRPDSMPPSFSSYTLTLTNPDIPAPTSTNAHKLINSFGSGVVPVWVTGSVLNTIVYNTAFSQQLSATDADGAPTITYTVASGSFPTGISLSSSGLISGTSTSTTQGDYAVTVTATDRGGNAVNKAFTMTYAAASGGTITSSGTTVTHTFNSTTNFVSTRTLTLNYTIYGGGGGGGGATAGSSRGGSWGGSGGGGGASIASGSTSKTAATYLVTSGAAGNAGTGGNGVGTGGGAGGTSGIATITTAAGANGGNIGPAPGNNGGNGGTGGSTGGNGGVGNQNPGGNSGNAGASGSGSASGAGGGGAGGGGFNNAGGGAGGTPFGGSGGFGGQAGNAGDNAGGPGAAANGAGGGGGGGGSGGYRNAGGNGGAGGVGTVVISYS